MNNCELCGLNTNPSEGFIITFCKTCNIPLIVLRKHRPNFTKKQKELIKTLFPDRKIRWEMRRIQAHAHCHILD